MPDGPFLAMPPARNDKPSPPRPRQRARPIRPRREARRSSARVVSGSTSTWAAA